MSHKPRQTNKSAMLRQWEMLRMLTVSRSDDRHEGRWDKASDIASRLKDAGYDVSVRTVQRDLKELSAIFPIELNDKNPRDYGWRWIRGASLDIPGMSVSEALAMRLVEMHLTPLLPASMLDGLSGVFGRAQTSLDKLQKESGNPSKAWLDKVRVVPPAQPMLPPSVDRQLQAEIYRAILYNRQLTVTYRSFSGGQAREYILHPLGLIMRGPVSYLAASAWDYADVRLYALHRFESAEMLEAAAITPDGFNLDRALANGLADFAHGGETIRLEIRCRKWVAAFLAETPLSADQQTEQDTGGWIRLTASVNDTWQLRWWILAQGPSVEVCMPKDLREEIRKTLSEAIGQYEQDKQEMVHRQERQSR